MSQIRTPFFNRRRITDPAYFFGRRREVERLYSAVATHQCLSIVGERKLGKSSLLTHLTDPDETAGADEVQAVLDKRAIDLNGASLTTVLDNLEMSDILTRSGPRSNLYRFKIDLIRRWIYATRPN